MGGVRPEPRAGKAGAGAGRRPEPDAPPRPMEREMPRRRALVAAGHERHAVARDPDAVASATAKTAISANADRPFAPPYARQSRHRILANSATARGPALDPSRSGSFGRSRPWATAWSGS